MEVKPIPLSGELTRNYISFINKHRGHATNEKSFKWQFSYLPEKSVVTGLVKDENTLGTQCMMPFPMLNSQVKYLSGKCENSYLEKSLRGKGEFNKMFDFATNLCKEKSLELLWAFTPALKPYSRLGFTVYKDCLRQSFLWVKLPAIRNYFKGRSFKGVLAGILSYFLLMISVLKLRIKSKNLATDLSSSYQELNARELAGLQQSICELHPTLNQLNFDNGFLDWRVNHNPNISSKNLFIYKAGKLVGHFIYSIKEKKAHIKSFLYSDEALLEQIILFFAKNIKEEGLENFIFQGNLENSLNKSVFQLLTKLNLRSIPTKGWDFVFKHEPQINKSTLSPSDFLINHLWTEGYA